MKNRNLNHKDDWKTPAYIYDELNTEFNFDFDPCPLHSDFDGLSIDWGKRNFINPPYSQKLKEAFIKFKNTSGALAQCLEDWELSEDASEYEIRGKEQVIELAHEIVRISS